MKKIFGRLNIHTKGYGDELIATGLVLAVALTGSFFLLSQIKPIPTTPKSETVALASPSPSSSSQVLGTQSQVTNPEEMVELSIPTPSPSPTPTPIVIAAVAASPTPDPNQVAEYLVAADKDFDTDKYLLTLKNLKMSIKGGTFRSFKFDAILANKSVTEGLKNQLSVKIVRDGNVVTDNAYVSVSESKTVMPGQKLTFSATISLIDGTDVASIKFNPITGGAAAVEYVVVQ